MKNLLKLEEACMLALAVYLTSALSYSWWLYWVLFLTPDIGMIGYFINTRTGAWCYNVLHHKGLAITIYLIGLTLHTEAMQFAGLLLFGHSAFDRLLGYGLKYSDDFKHTHLGWIGKA
jgi:hypothetical protein